MSIGHLIHKIWLFQNSTLKIQGQGHEWGESWKSQHGSKSNILSTHFHSMSICHPIPEIRIFSKFDLSWKSKVKVMVEIKVESHKVGVTSYQLTSLFCFVPCQLALPFLRYSIFKIWSWKSKAKVMGEGNVESHNMGATFYRLTSLSFHVNWTSHSWDTAFSKFDPENPRSRSWVRCTLKVTTWV